MKLTPDELRVIGLAGTPLIRMLKAKEEIIVATMYGAFRNGEKDYLPAVAELACLRGLIHDIESAIKIGEKYNG